MKQPLTYIALLALTIACQDDTKQLLSQIDGRWQVHSLIYKGEMGLDSVVSLTGTPTYLTFDQCASSANNSSPTSCRVEYSSGGQPYGFSYQAPNGTKSLYISPLAPLHDPVYKRIAEQLSGSYEVLTLSDNTLIIRHPLQGTKPGYTSIQYSASK